MTGRPRTEGATAPRPLPRSPPSRSRSVHMPLAFVDEPLSLGVAAAQFVLLLIISVPFRTLLGVTMHGLGGSHGPHQADTMIFGAIALIAWLRRRRGCCRTSMVTARVPEHCLVALTRC